MSSLERNTSPVTARPFGVLHPSAPVTERETGETMSTLTQQLNATSTELIGDLSPETEVRPLADLTPVLATPAAVATGVAVTAAAFGAGYAAEEAADG